MFQTFVTLEKVDFAIFFCKKRNVMFDHRTLPFFFANFSSVLAAVKSFYTGRMPPAKRGLGCPVLYAPVVLLQKKKLIRNYNTCKKITATNQKISFSSSKVTYIFCEICYRKTCYKKFFVLNFSTSLYNKHLTLAVFVYCVFQVQLYFLFKCKQHLRAETENVLRLYDFWKRPYHQQHSDGY